MQLQVERAFNRNVITPYTQDERKFYLLFLRDAEGPFWVRHTSYKLETLVTIGEVCVTVKEKTRVVGNIFHTNAQAQCEGTYLLAYSGIFGQSVQKRLPTDFNMELILKERGFHMFNQRNRATLIISPALRRNIRENLEI